MFKKFLLLFICMIFVSFQTIQAESNVVTVNIDGHLVIPIDVPAEVVNNKVFVPLRLIAEALGEQVDWDEHAKSVTVGYSRFTRFTHKVGTNYVTIESTNEIINIAEYSYIRNNRVMMNIELISEAIYLRVYWDEDNKILDIYTSPGADPNYQGTPVDIWVTE